MRRNLLFAIVALVLLGFDFILFPDFVEDRGGLDALPVNSLLKGDLMTMGTYRLHILRTSCGRIADESYMRKLGPRVNGLAVTAFSAIGTDPVGIGTLTKAVREALPESDAAKLAALIQNFPTLTPGRVQVLELQKPHPHGLLFGIDVVLILRAKRGGDREAKEALRAGLTEILEQAGKHSVSGLLLPILTVAPEGEESPSFDDFFRFLFESLRTSKSPRLIDISFFDGWSTGRLENATAAFNAHWSAEIQNRRGFLTTLHRFQLRLLLIGLAICFIVSGRHMTLQLRSACTLATAYTLTLLGSFKTVETITEGLGDTAKNITLIAMMLVLAIGFPHIMRWSAKDLFREGEGDGRG